MITITISELKRFLSNASSIPTSKIIPILSYVKLECKGATATLTKTNLHSFVIVDIEAEFKKDETILIDEQVLSGAVDFSKGSELKISVVGKNVVMNDGHGDTKCQVQDINLFPAIETNFGKDKVEINKEVLTALKLAKQHILVMSDKEARAWMSFIHIRDINEKSYVIGANGAILYFKSFEERLPKISLDPDTITAISKYPTLDYSENNKYDYFQSLGVTYGFIKTESVCPKFEPIIEKLKSQNSFIVNTKDIIFFCEKAIRINTSSLVPEVSIEDSGNGSLLFKYSALSDNESAEDTVHAENKTNKIEKLLFNPRSMVMALKDLGFEKIKVSTIPGHMILSSDEEKYYLGAVMENQKSANK